MGNRGTFYRMSPYNPCRNLSLKAQNVEFDFDVSAHTLISKERMSKLQEPISWVVLVEIRLSVQNTYY